MNKNRILLMFACLFLLGAACESSSTTDKNVQNTLDFVTAKSITPREFYTARMKNRLSIKASHSLFEIIKETDNQVLAGFISQKDIQEKRNRYSSIVKCDKRRLTNEFPLYKTFTAFDAREINIREHARYDPFTMEGYQSMRTRRHVKEADYNDTHMIFSTRYEYSGDKGPWYKFKMVVSIDKTNITDVSSERIE